jgi:hypothetical protein
MSEQKNCLPAVRALLCIWVLSVLSVCIFIILAIAYQHRNSAITQADYFDLNRLNHLQNKGLVVVGNSLIACAFPYDEAMENISKKAGVSMQFVRFSLAGADPADLILLLKPILLAKPKWVFIQVEPFIVINSPQTFPQKLAFDVHEFLAMIIHRNQQAHKQPQSDDNFAFKTNIAAHTDVRNFFLDPVLSLPYQQFLQAARRQGAQVIFLQINHSKESLEGKFILNKENAIQVLSKKYHLETWRFPALDQQYYTDEEHLNAAGRIIFTTWFITRFKNEFMDH